jgi:hypothetical protein
MKNHNYNGILINKSQFTTAMMNDIEKCVRGTGSMTLTTNSAPEHVRKEFVRNGLPTGGFEEGWWICSEEFKGNWAQVVDCNNGKIMVVFPKKIATSYMKLHPCTFKG